MFSRLIAIWNKDSLIKLAFGDVNVMLKKAQMMFLAVSDLFLQGTKVNFDIYAMDKEINRAEIAVRRKVLEHLSINPQQELVSSLILTIIINDIERIGDYAKNIYELSETYEPCLDMPPYTDVLGDATNRVRRMFDLTLIAFDKEDHEKAEQVMVEHSQVNKVCEKTIRELADDSKVPLRQSVALVLYARFLKRVSAHLSNVMSSVIRPYDHIGYYQDQLAEKE